MRVIAFISDAWRKRFGWDEPAAVTPEDTLRAHGIDPETFLAALREARDAQPDPLEARSSNARRQHP